MFEREGDKILFYIIVFYHFVRVFISIGKLNQG